MNQAELTNLQIAADQAQKQSLARSATRALNREAMQSMVAKKLQDEAVKNELRVMENMYKFRFGPDYRATHQGQDPVWRMNQAAPSSPTSTTTVTPEKKEKTKKFGGSLVQQFKRYKY